MRTGNDAKMERTLFRLSPPSSTSCVFSHCSPNATAFSSSTSTPRRLATAYPTAGFVPSLLSLLALKSRALRRGVWFRVGPAARALIDAAILYLKRGGRIKSPALAEALRKAAEEVLRLAAPICLLARAAKSIATNATDI
jgi:hypothetical protein